VTPPARVEPVSPVPIEHVRIARDWRSRANAHPTFGPMMARRLPRFVLRRMTEIVTAAFADRHLTEQDYHLNDPFRDMPGLGLLLIAVLNDRDAPIAVVLRVPELTRHAAAPEKE
jgi:hypothetical protein